MDGLKMTVSTFPTEGLNLKEDIELIKVGLLYSDKVILKSVKADIIYRVLAYEDKTRIIEKMTYMKEIATMANDSIVEDIEYLIAEYHNIISRKKLNDSSRALFKLQLEREFSKGWADIEERIFETIDVKGVLSLENAINQNRLDVVRYKTDASNIFSDEYVYEYLESIEETLLQYNNYPLFDSEISRIVNLGVRENVIDIAPNASERIKHSNLTLTMLKSLPSFNQAKIDEIVDIRKELDKYLTRFRSAIVKYSSLLEADIADEELFYEIDKLIVSEINPSIQDIEEQCMSNKYLKELAYTLVKSKYVHSASVGLMLGNVYDLLSLNTNLAAGTLAFGSEIVKHHREWCEKQREIENDNLFFYYQAGEKLQNI